jgi:hypothetical protein
MSNAWDMLAARQKQGAARLGIPVAEYQRQNAAGNEWCSGHHDWCPRANFYRRRDRWTRLDTQCRDASREAARINMARLRERRRAS